LVEIGSVVSEEKIFFKGVGPLSGVFGPYLKTYNL
jgi:hypothetical protein